MRYRFLALAAALVFAPAGRYIPSPQAAGTGQTGGTWETAETAESGAGEAEAEAGVKVEV